MVPKELKDQGRVGLVMAPEVAPEPDGEWRPKGRRMTIQQFLVEGMWWDWGVECGDGNADDGSLPTCGKCKVFG